jgi:hypothetical protein
MTFSPIFGEKILKFFLETRSMLSKVPKQENLNAGGVQNDLGIICVIFEK